MAAFGISMQKLVDRSSHTRSRSFRTFHPALDLKYRLRSSRVRRPWGQAWTNISANGVAERPLRLARLRRFNPQGLWNAALGANGDRHDLSTKARASTRGTIKMRCSLYGTHLVCTTMRANTPKYVKFGRLLAEARAAAGLESQSDLAALLDCTQQTVSRWELGEF